MVELQPSKLVVRVRFPSPAPLVDVVSPGQRRFLRTVFLRGPTRRYVSFPGRPRDGRGTFIVVPRGAVHTFATRRGAHVLAVMSPEIAELIDRLHEPMSTGDAQALWGRYHSSLA